MTQDPRTTSQPPCGHPVGNVPAVKQCRAAQTDTGADLQLVGREKLEQVGLTVRWVRKMAKSLLVQLGRGV